MNNKQIDRLKNKLFIERYKHLAEVCGYYTEYHYSIGTDAADEIKELSKTIVKKSHNAVFFVGQLYTVGCFLLPQHSNPEPGFFMQLREFPVAGQYPVPIGL